MKNTALFFCMMAMTAAAAAADSYTIDPSHTFPRFEINHFGFSTHHGQFNKTAGKIVLDRAAKTGSIDITVQTASIGTGAHAARSRCPFECGNRQGAGRSRPA